VKVARILAVDPGNMTGVAWMGGFEALTPTSPQTWERTAMEATRQCDALLDGFIEVLVVCESFIPRPGAGTFQPDAMYTIGALRYLAEKYGHGFELQSPADAKRFSTDAKLKSLGWYVPTPDGHANDALRHLLLAMVRHGKIDLGRLE
jgi:hypothetical protein